MDTKIIIVLSDGKRQMVGQYDMPGPIEVCGEKADAFLEGILAHRIQWSMLNPNTANNTDKRAALMRDVVDMVVPPPSYEPDTQRLTLTEEQRDALNLILSRARWKEIGAKAQPLVIAGNYEQALGMCVAEVTLWASSISCTTLLDADLHEIVNRTRVFVEDLSTHSIEQAAQMMRVFGQ